MNKILGKICGMVITILCGLESQPRADEINWICVSVDTVTDSFSINLSKHWQPLKRSPIEKSKAIGGKFLSSRKATLDIHTFQVPKDDNKLFETIQDMASSFSTRIPERIRVFNEGEDTIVITFLRPGLLPDRSVQVINAVRTNFRDRFTQIMGSFPEAAKVEELVEMERAIKSFKVLPR